MTHNVSFHINLSDIEDEAVISTQMTHSVSFNINLSNLKDMIVT